MTWSGASSGEHFVAANPPSLKTNFGIANAVTDFGADPTGATDSTVALQAWLDTKGYCFLPPGPSGGFYKITSPLIVRPSQYSPIQVVGAGRPSRNLSGIYSYIRQDGGNLPIFKFTTNGMSGAAFRDFGCGYSAPSGAGNTAEIAFHFDEPTAGNNATWFTNVFERIAVLNAYSGWSLITTGGESASIWDTHWRDILLDNLQHNAFALKPSAAVGQPICTWRNIRINNANGAVVSDGRAWDLGAVEAHMSGLDVEGWYNCFIECGGGFATSIDGLHIEHHVMDAVQTFYYRLMSVANGHLRLKNASFSFTSIGGGAFGLTALVVAANTGDTADLDAITTFSPVAPTGTLHVAIGGGGGYRIGDVKTGANTAFASPTGDAATMAHSTSYAAATQTGQALAQTAAVASLATVTSPNDGLKHLYRVGGGVTITTLGSASINLEVTYTDDNGTARTCIIPLCAEAGTFAAAANTADAWKGFVEIAVNPNVAITLLTAGTFTGGTYNVVGSIERIR